MENIGFAYSGDNIADLVACSPHLRLPFTLGIVAPRSVGSGYCHCLWSVSGSAQSPTLSKVSRCLSDIRGNASIQFQLSLLILQYISK